MKFNEWCLKTGVIKYFVTVLICLVLIVALISLADPVDDEYLFEDNQFINGPSSYSIEEAGRISFYDEAEEYTWMDLSVDAYRIGYRQGVADSENVDFDLLELRLDKFRKALKED